MKSLVFALVSSAVLAAPPIPAAPKWSPPTVTQRTLASGAKLWVLPQKGLPLVHIAAIVEAGSVLDPANKPGLADLTTTSVEEAGAGTRSGPEVKAAFEALGSDLVTATSADVTTLEASTLSSNLEPALALFIDLLARPRFDGAKVLAIQSRLHAELTSGLDEPNLFGYSKLLLELYGANPRNHLSEGTPEGLAACSADDAVKFHAATWTSSNVTFLLVGDVDADRAKQVLDKLAPKAWGTPWTRPAATPVKPNGRWVAFDRPDAPQTVVIFARLAPDADSAQAAPVELLSTVMGGSFTSRLMQNLREKHGYTYGVRAGVQSARDARPLMISTSLKTEVTVPGLTELVGEMEHANTVTEAELNKARALEETALVEGFSSGTSALGTLGGLIASGRQPTALAKEQADRAAAKLDDLRAAAGTHFELSGYTVVLVGDKKKLEKDLAAKFPTHPIEWH